MDILTVTHFINGFLMIAIPIILGIYLANRFRLGWKFWWAGASIFILSQIFHIPFNSYILNPILTTFQQRIPGVMGLLVISILLGLSAGTFESVARYGMYRWWLKENRSWRMGVLSGAGHGGMEAIILGGLVILTYVNMLAVRNADLTRLNLSPDQLETTRQQILLYWNLPWYDTLLGALERIFTIPFHIAASVIVLQVFTRKPGHQQMRWLVLAIFLHSLMDASAVFIAGQHNPYLAEAILGILAVFDIIIIFLLRQPEPNTLSPLLQHSENAALSVTLPPIQETSDNLEKTRYQ